MGEGATAQGMYTAVGNGGQRSALRGNHVTPQGGDTVPGLGSHRMW